MPGSHPTILVAAGTNGAGKSSIVEPFVENARNAYFNPDRYAQSLVKRGLSLDDANALAWTKGYERLCAAVENNAAFAFETTLGGHSIAYQLMRALAFSRRVTILYVGLASVDLHIQRVRDRVARGGHDIPEDVIRRRYDDSRRNLLSFIGTAAAIRVWNNSAQSADGRPAGAVEVFRIEDRKLVLPKAGDASAVPAWARPLLAQALKLESGRPR
jgi:predicted ABC-type ATPase